MPAFKAFKAGQTAQAANIALKSSVKSMDQAKHCAVLWFGDIYQRELFKDLGYSSITLYAKLELGFSAARTCDFVRICRRLKKLPRIEEEVRKGKLGYTKARELVKVADSKNQDAWLEVARKNTRDDLAEEVKRARRKTIGDVSGQTTLLPEKPLPKASPPAQVRLEFSPTQLARYEALWEKIRKMGGVPADKTEALLHVFECYLAGEFPGGNAPTNKPTEKETVSPQAHPSPRIYQANQPSTQIHIHQCPDCHVAKVSTARGELSLSPAELSQAKCDAQISRPGLRNKSTIPPKIRRAVFARDRHRCQRPGCTRTRFLEVHHIIPRSRGGANVIENLITLCGACHRLVHEKKMKLSVAPGRAGTDPRAME